MSAVFQQYDSIDVFLKHLHIGSVAVSYALFWLRGVWVIRASTILQQTWVHVVPHAVDTVLLGSAIALAWRIGVSPFAAPWLMAKLLALAVYIGLGFVAIRFARTRRTHLVAWVLAQGVFLYIVGVAVAKDVLSWGAL